MSVYACDIGDTLEYPGFGIREKRRGFVRDIIEGYQKHDTIVFFNHEQYYITQTSNCRMVLTETMKIWK